MLFSKKLLSAEQEARLVKAINVAESFTSGEVRVHIEKNHKGDPLTAAQKQFEKLNMQNTKDKNGILFYLAHNNKTFAVWGDEGIHQKVTDEFWKSISDTAISYFKKQDYITGLEKAVELCGQKLKEYFPLQSDDKNELPNQISY